MKDTSIIPHSEYCYTWTEVPSKENNYTGKIKQCPYYQIKNIDGVEIPWCDYLELGGTPGDGTWDGWNDYEKALEKLSKHFGSKEEVDNKLCLFLLFDSCKECGINIPEDRL